MLRPKISLSVGNKLYDQHTLALRLRRTQLPALDRLEVALPAAVQFDAAAGDDCSLEIDGGDGAATVFTGTLTQIRRAFTGLCLTAHNGGLALARYRPAASYEQLNAGEIIDNFCGDVSVSVAKRVDGPALALYVADGRASAAEEIARLALDAGAGAAFDGEGNLHVTEEGGPAGEMALRYGRELLEVETGTISDPNVTITVVGEGAGSPSSPEGRWVVSDFLAGSGPTPGLSDRIVARPELRTSSDATAAADALMQRASVALLPVKLRLWLNPKIEPGMRLELSDMPDDMPVAECRVLQLVSTHTPDGPMITEVWASGHTAVAGAGGLP
jgi:hypothetical protein